ncbi:hypothetical protein PGTUg99_035379 [Puccinia graminis f. sp. tritici]|uniref:Uncharacterized protein n=1 Tax=Puccinia graminis f. sp. tritici TaxID=56615 RepID=A0A5B0M227_PUCGR|nr:hypothetical protein PGTUg99_007273 [Puccinia graminis f. sp. tritici]KAA1073042.1 hypothetical protein PGTUg99_022892 [Puccinia graminis f. sp. tritici]KAA1131992.1 hypothetical protein PGTUg99_035379 [Puccinia graminis f. sp. tritici]
MPTKYCSEAGMPGAPVPDLPPLFIIGPFQSTISSRPKIIVRNRSQPPHRRRSTGKVRLNRRGPSQTPNQLGETIQAHIRESVVQIVFSCWSVIYISLYLVISFLPVVRSPVHIVFISIIRQAAIQSRKYVGLTPHHSRQRGRRSVDNLTGLPSDRHSRRPRPWRKTCSDPILVLNPPFMVLD